MQHFLCAEFLISEWMQNSYYTINQFVISSWKRSGDYFNSCEKRML